MLEDKASKEDEMVAAQIKNAEFDSFMLSIFTPEQMVEIEKNAAADDKKLFPLNGKSFFYSWCRWVDHNHCAVTMLGNFDSSEFKNRCYAMRIALHLPTDTTLKYVLATSVYLVVLTFRRIFFPLG
jgi:hypothetical protein